MVQKWQKNTLPISSCKILYNDSNGHGCYF
jgi:hypothetical protein